MKEATIILNLSKEGHHVTKANVTPVEALLLVAEHHRNVGGNPIEVVKDTVKDVTTKKDGKDVARTDDEELARLRGKYPAGKIKALLTEVKHFPDTFEKAIELGTGLQLPSGAIAATKLL